MRRAYPFLSLSVLAFVLAGCAGDQAPGLATPADAGLATDGTTPDSSSPTDTGGVDSETAKDSGLDSTPGDAVADTDASGGVDAKTDTTVPSEAGSVDTSVPDTGPVVITTDAERMDTFVDDARLDSSPDASAALVPVGKACSSKTDCDPTGAGSGDCSNALTPPDFVDPSPTCVALECEASAGIGKSCGAAGAGICVSGGALGYCMSRCSFGASGSATGCVGKTSCTVVAWARSGGSITGSGFCRGGCTADSDCSGGQKCQKETGSCVATLTVYAKTLGASCSSGADCDCMYNGATSSGYCTRYCRTGDAAAACPTGFSCDPGLPNSDTMGTLFSSSPTGLNGRCLKNCSVDGDCPTGAHCESNVATASKVCRVP